jgi:peptide/nickel transport system permease protein
LLAFIGRRISLALLILFGSTYLTYQLAAYSGDPLAGIRESTDPKKEVIIAELTKTLQLDVPPPARYFLWLQNAIQGDFGNTVILRLPVVDQIAAAIPITLRLVTTATVLSVIIGIGFGVLSAIRQYSRLDNSLTLLSFFLFSLPIFWIAVMLKEFMAIRFNDFLVNPTIDIVSNILISAAIAVIISGFVSGTRKRVLITWFATFGLFVTLFSMASLTAWFRYPSMGIFGIAVLGVACSLGFTHLFSGLGNRKALGAGLSSVALGLIAYYPFQSLAGPGTNYELMLALAALMLSSSYFIGYFFTKIDKGPVIRVSVLSALMVALFTVADKLMQTWDTYFKLSDGRPIQTQGSYNITISSNDFWITNLDLVTHLFLPTTALALGFAGYLRYSRASMLEVLNMDYIRTARAKGMPEREVVLRHAIRNAMLPLTTLLTFEVAGLIGGAIITEGIFGWRGMGSLSNEAIQSQDLNLLMATFAISAFLTIMATLVADLLYSALDPRIRIRK